MRSHFVLVAALIAVLAATGCGSTSPTSQAPSLSATSPCNGSPAPASYKHIIWIWEENHSYDQIIGSPNAPYINSLVSKCGLATNYHNVEHESLTNYLAALSGQIADPPRVSGRDCYPWECLQPQDNLLHQIDTSSTHLTWRMYAGSATTNCDNSKNTLVYTSRHDPAPFFSDLAATCSVNDVPITTDPHAAPTDQRGPLLNDLKNDTLANFTFIGPNLCDDGHYIIPSVPYCHPADIVGAKVFGNDNPSSNEQIDSAESLPQRIKVTDNWLASWMPVILNSPAYNSGDTAVFITWDEGETADYALGEHCWDTEHQDSAHYPSCHVPLLVIAPHVHPGTSWNVAFNHYNLLQATQQNFQLSALPMSELTGGVPTGNQLRTVLGR